MNKQEFEWLEVLGRGMSGVCRKVRGKDGNIMVVKQIDISFVAPEEYESATREARLLSSLSHPNVIRFYDEFVDDEMLHIVMEYAPYGTLKQNLAKMVGLIPESSAVWIMMNIMEGLNFLHQRKIVHRDLKSDNIFIGENHVPKVGDFGVATRLNSAQPMAMSCVGTPLYLSPELCNGEPYNTKTDMWAGGVLMYEVCSKGRLPFAAGNQGAVINKILIGQYSPLDDSYSSQVHALVGECLSRDPRRRPTAEELWGGLHTLYTAHMKQEAPPSNSESGAPGSDHFTLASSPNAGQRRSGEQPLWWEWASNNGFVSGKFRTLYGGTPHPSPSEKPAAPHPNRRRAGQRSSLDLGMTVTVGAILPFSRDRHRPTSAPSTPSSTDSRGKRGVGARDTALLDFLVSTPAILEGPLQGPLWRNPKSKLAKGAETPVSPAWGQGFGEDAIGAREHGILRSASNYSHGHLDDAHGHLHDAHADGPRGRRRTLALTTVDDLTGWLQQKAQLEQEDSEWRPDKSTRPTSSPDYSCSGARGRQMGIAGRGQGLGVGAVLGLAGPLAGPPSRVIGLRLGADRLQHNQASCSQHPSSTNPLQNEASFLAPGNWGGSGAGWGNAGAAGHVGQHPAPVLHPTYQPLHVQNARGKKGPVHLSSCVHLSVNGVQSGVPPAGTLHWNAARADNMNQHNVNQHKSDERHGGGFKDLQRLPSGVTAPLLHPLDSSAPGPAGAGGGGGGGMGGKERHRKHGLQLQGFGLNNNNSCGLNNHFSGLNDNSSAHNVEPRPAVSLVLRDLARPEGLGNHVLSIKRSNYFKGSHLRQGDKGTFDERRKGKHSDASAMGSSLQMLQMPRSEVDQVLMPRPSC